MSTMIPNYAAYPGCFSQMPPPPMVMPMQSAESMISPPLSGRLSNGSWGYFQQTPHLQETALSIFLPINATQASLRAILPDLLQNGSGMTKTFLAQASAMGIRTSIAEAGDKLQLNFVAPAGKEAELMQTAMQLLTRPIVDPMTYNQLKEDLIQNIQNIDASPEAKLDETVNKAFYGAFHPYGKTRQEVIRELSNQSLAGAMSAYQQVAGQPQGIKMLMVSPLAQDCQKALIEQGIQQFGWYVNPYTQGVYQRSVPPLPNLQGKRGPFLVANEALPRAMIQEMWSAPGVGDPDYPAFCLLRSIMKGMSSSFFKVLRTQKHLVYSTQQSYSDLPNNGTTFNLNAEVDYDKLGPAMAGIREVICSLTQTPVTAAQLRMAKESSLLSIRDAKETAPDLLELNTPRLQNDLLPCHPDSLQAAMERVTVADIQRVANRVFNPTSAYHVIGVSAPQKILNQWFPSKPKN
jgi:predicted Zn-dependent peptidase